MQHPATAAPSPTSFKRLLAEFATPENKFPPARDVGELADDIATLSYEQAVRRYQPLPFGPRSTPENSFPPSDLPHTATVPSPTPSPAVSAPPLSAIRKEASVTVRLTQPESDRLRARAAEAGLTVSSYLRSCAFEVETLRAQVKDTVAQLRQNAAPAPKKPWWRRLIFWRIAA